MKYIYIYLSIVALLPMINGASVSVKKVKNNWVFEDGIDKQSIAYGTLTLAMNETGWNILKIESNVDNNNEDQSYAAGLVEGYLTEDLIFIHSKNIYGEKAPSKHIQSILDENEEWEKQESSKGDKTYWNHRKYLDLQVDGVFDGYMIANKDKPERYITKWQVQYANYDGDVGDWNGLPHNETIRPDKYEIDRIDHCSALIRLLKDKSDILIGQSTWSALHTMFKIYKIYDIFLHISTGIIPGHLQGFSAYPARISSGDDYYTIGDHMVIQETTIGNFNKELEKYMNGKAVMQWARNLIANRLAISPRMWCKLYAMYNNGCYANQWMVLDYDQFVPGYGLKRNGLYLLEQLPGYVRYEDISEVINNEGYFASYNIAYFDDVYKIGGTYDKWKLLCPRAMIFRRDMHRVIDVRSMRALLRYNDFKNDPLSRCAGTPGYTGSYAIGCRNDLNDPNGTYPRPGLGQRNHAATDAKITSMSLLHNNQSSQIIAGPPYKHVGVFDWTTSAFKDAPHWCHPLRFEFPWINVSEAGDITKVSYEYDDAFCYVSCQ